MGWCMSSVTLFGKHRSSRVENIATLREDKSGQVEQVFLIIFRDYKILNFFFDVRQQA